MAELEPGLGSRAPAEGRGLHGAEQSRCWRAGMVPAVSIALVLGRRSALRCWSAPATGCFPTSRNASSSSSCACVCRSGGRIPIEMPGRAACPLRAWRQSSLSSTRPPSSRLLVAAAAGGPGPWPCSGASLPLRSRRERPGGEASAGARQHLRAALVSSSTWQCSSRSLASLSASSLAALGSSAAWAVRLLRVPSASSRASRCCSLRSRC